MITSEQLNEFLSEYGISMPTAIVDAIVAQLATVSACVDGNYDAATATLIYFYAGAIIAGSTGTRQIKSQDAPSGAGRSFDNNPSSFTQLRRTLTGLDSYGCTTELVGADPQQGNYFAVVGGC